MVESQMIRKETMTDVSLIGLGSMGLALAKTLLRNHFTITVWNRSSAKAESLVREGATLASSVTEAIHASPIIIVCVADYKTAKSLLAPPEASAALPGRVLS
jgi:3-hydroxyisobutyrate dehydrogenase-like beta-hydroxyacid dehydrogenase